MREGLFGADRHSRLKEELQNLIVLFVMLCQIFTQSMCDMSNILPH